MTGWRHVCTALVLLFPALCRECEEENDWGIGRGKHLNCQTWCPLAELHLHTHSCYLSSHRWLHWLLRCPYNLQSVSQLDTRLRTSLPFREPTANKGIRLGCSIVLHRHLSAFLWRTVRSSCKFKKCSQWKRCLFLTLGKCQPGHPPPRLKNYFVE